MRVPGFVVCSSWLHLHSKKARKWVPISKYCEFLDKIFFQLRVMIRPVRISKKFVVDMLTKIVSFSYYWPENGPSAPKWALKAQFCVFFHRVLFSLRQHDRADRIPPRKICGKMWCSGLIIYKPRLIMWCSGLKMWCSGLII